jgi:hypothetical protein
MITKVGLLDREFSCVSFHERKMEDLMKIDDGRDDEIPFAAVARASEQQAEFYDVCGAPVRTGRGYRAKRRTAPQNPSLAGATHDDVERQSNVLSGLSGQAERVKAAIGRLRRGQSLRPKWSGPVLP